MSLVKGDYLDNVGNVIQSLERPSEQNSFPEEHKILPAGLAYRVQICQLPQLHKPISRDKPYMYLYLLMILFF